MARKRKRKKKKIAPLHLSHPGYPENYDPGGERGHITSNIFQEPMEIPLELTSDPGGWSGRRRSTPSLPSIHSIPAQQPMRIHLGSISRTKLTPAGFISRVKESTKRSRRDYFSGSSPSFSSKRPHRYYFSGPSSHSRACKGPDTELSLQPQTNWGHTQAGPQRGAISLPQSGCHLVSHHPQTPPRTAHPDSVIEVGLEPPAAALTSRPDTPGKWFRPPTRSLKRSRPTSPPSPRRPRKHFSSLGRWCE